MNKKIDKKLCWNCDGEVSLHLSQCPFCGVDATQAPLQRDPASFKGFSNPFQTAAADIPKPPYANVFGASDEEWNKSLNEEEPEGVKEPDSSDSRKAKSEMVALLLLLPGVVFFLFGLTLFFFSDDGVLALEWNQNMAYFYFLGAAPLILLGWRALK